MVSLKSKTEALFKGCGYSALNVKWDGAKDCAIFCKPNYYIHDRANNMLKKHDLLVNVSLFTNILADSNNINIVAPTERTLLACRNFKCSIIINRKT